MPPPSSKTTRRPRSYSAWACLGKTVITLAAIWNLLLDSFRARRVLIVAPLRVARDTWPAEATKSDHLAGLTVAVAVGSKAQCLDALAVQAMVTVTNRENVPWLVRNFGKSWPFDMVVIDELSSFKNHRAQRFKALARARPLVTRDRCARSQWADGPVGVAPPSG